MLIKNYYYYYYLFLISFSYGLFTATNLSIEYAKIIQAAETVFFHSKFTRSSRTTKLSFVLPLHAYLWKHVWINIKPLGIMALQRDKYMLAFKTWLRLLKRFFLWLLLSFVGQYTDGCANSLSIIANLPK